MTRPKVPPGAFVPRMVLYTAVIDHVGSRTKAADRPGVRELQEKEAKSE